LIKIFTYCVGLESPATVTWSVPPGASILSGQGTSNVRVQWDNDGGFLTADVNTPCGDQTFGIEIAAGLVRTSSLENFDEAGEATFDFSSGVLTEVQNPTPNSINNSDLVGEYVRSSSDQFDVLQYDLVGILGDVTPFTTGAKQFFVDVLSDAPAGTEILLQLETSNSAATNFPRGRHSRYRAETGEPDVINANITLEESAPLQLVLTNINGQLVRALDLGTVSPGQHTSLIQVDLLPPGTYNLSLATKGLVLRSVSVVKQ